MWHGAWRDLLRRYTHSGDTHSDYTHSSDSHRLCSVAQAQSHAVARRRSARVRASYRTCKVEEVVEEEEVEEEVLAELLL